MADLSRLKLVNDYIPDGSTELTTLYDTKDNATLVRGFANFHHRFSDVLSTNLVCTARRLH
jgi:hypothetical protein